MSRFLLALAFAAPCLSNASAQEFRVVTTVRDLRAPQAGNSGVTTLTLFRQSKVYDYIDSVGEVIVFEPAANRFTILNLRRSLATTVDFDEVRQLLGNRRPEIRNYVAALRKNNSSEAAAAAQWFEFQLNPRFVEAVAEDQLTLRSEKCTYRVQLAPTKNPEELERYLAYADWMARLNSVLHPNAMFPEPRLALNASLRRQKRMPIRVELAVSDSAEALQSSPDLHLVAEHRISMNLESHDRSRITDWEAALASPRTTRTTFRRYQQAVLAAR